MTTCRLSTPVKFDRRLVVARRFGSTAISVRNLTASPQTTTKFRAILFTFAAAVHDLGR